MRLAFWSKCVPLETGSLSFITHEIIKEAAQALAARGRASHVRAEPKKKKKIGKLTFTRKLSLKCFFSVGQRLLPPKE